MAEVRVDMGIDLEAIVSELKLTDIKNWQIGAEHADWKTVCSYLYKFGTRGYFLARAQYADVRDERQNEQIWIRMGGTYFTTRRSIEDAKSGTASEVKAGKGVYEKRAYTFDVIYRPRNEDARDDVRYLAVKDLLTHLDKQAKIDDDQLQAETTAQVLNTLREWAQDREGTEKKWEEEAQAERDERRGRQPRNRNSPLVLPDQSGFVESPGTSLLIPGRGDPREERRQKRHRDQRHYRSHDDE